PYSHSHSDDEKAYKTAAERTAEASRDPLTRLSAFLIEHDIASEADLADIAASVDREVTEAAEAALRAPKPSPSTAGLYVYSPTVDPTSSAFETPAAPSGKPVTMVAAINQTLKDEMRANPHIVVFGEDVADVTRE